MVLDLSKFERRHDFNLDTEALGQIQCGTLKAKMLSIVGKMLKNPDVNALDFSRRVLGLVGSSGANIEATNVAKDQEVPLTDEELQQITDNELETFAELFVVHNEWLLPGSRQVSTNENGEKAASVTPKIADFPKGEDEGSSDYFVRVLRRYLDDQSKRMKKMMAPLSGMLASNMLAEQYKKLVEPLSMFNDSTMESLRRNFSLSDQLQDSIKAFKQNTIDREIARVTIEPELTPLRPFPIPENPLIETNKRLGSMLEHFGEMRSLTAQSAELISNMNDTALAMQASFMSNARSTQTHTQFAIGIAALSLVLSSFFSWLSYDDGKQQAEKNEAQIGLFQTEIRNLIAAQEKDRAVLVGALKEARQPSQAKPAASSKSSVTDPKGQSSWGKAAP